MICSIVVSIVKPGGVFSFEDAVLGFFNIVYLQLVEVVKGLDVLEDGLYGLVQRLILAVVGFAYEIDITHFLRHQRSRYLGS